MIDPESKYFKGAPRSHTHVHKCESDRHENNNLFPPFSSSSQAASAAGVPPSRGRSRTSRASLCDRRMTLIVDDTVDVWANDLANLCVTRRFVGDQLDDGLMLLSYRLSTAHRNFYKEAPEEGYSFNAPKNSPRYPPSAFTTLADARGQLLVGCTICLTGVVNNLSAEDSLDDVPLAILIKLYGGELTTSIDAATHLVAKRKDGWQSSPKIRKGLKRLQVRTHGTQNTTPPHTTLPSPSTHCTLLLAGRCPPHCLPPAKCYYYGARANRARRRIRGSARIKPQVIMLRERFGEVSGAFRHTHRELRFEGDKHISKGPPESIYAPLAVYVNSPSRLESRRDETLAAIFGAVFSGFRSQL